MIESNRWQSAAPRRSTNKYSETLTALSRE
jgi:hypothetical protein